MPSFTSIVNSLLRTFPSEKANHIYRAVQKLHPQSEALANAQLTRSLLDKQINAWLTRHAWEACRAWNWPFWINAQTTAGSLAYTNLTSDPVINNVSARDAAPIPGLPDTFAGTVDRRGMVTPSHGHFSLETWFRFPEGLTIPAALLDESSVAISSQMDAITFEIGTPHGKVIVRVEATAVDDIKFIRITGSCEPSGEAHLCPVSIYFAIRPYNLESVTPVHDLVYNTKGFWMSDSQVVAWFPHKPDISWASDARHGDAVFFLADPPERTAVRCPAGLANALTGWHLPLRDASPLSAEVILPLHPINAKSFPFAELLQDRRRKPASASPQQEMLPASRDHAITLQTGTALDQMLVRADNQLRSLTDISESLIHQRFLHKSNWLVAAVRALVYQGHKEQAARVLQLPLLDVQKNGNLTLAAGKWSLHGQVLTAAADYHRLTAISSERPVVAYSQLRNLARWIMRKRREIAHAPEKPQGLFPPGVTRSNTGVEYQLIDNFWGLQGLVSAASLARLFNEHRDAEVLHKEAAKYAANLSAAMHRELEYSVSQQLPGRLHRVFDPTTASEILEIALMPDTYRLLKAESWLPRLLNYLLEPIPNLTFQHPDFILRRIDEHGVFPARRLVLCLALQRTSDSRFPLLFAEALKMQTPLGSWTECLNPCTMMGTGPEMIDTEATALFTILVRQTLLQDYDDLALTISPGRLTAGDPSVRVHFNNAPTLHGAFTADWKKNGDDISLNLSTVTSDSTVEIYWNQDDESHFLGAGKQAAGTYNHKLTPFTNNHGR